MKKGKVEKVKKVKRLNGSKSRQRGKMLSTQNSWNQARKNDGVCPHGIRPDVVKLQLGALLWVQHTSVPCIQIFVAGAIIPPN